MPDELQIHLFQFLHHYPRTLEACRLTSRRFEQLATPHFFRDLKPRTLDHMHHLVEILSHTVLLSNTGSEKGEMAAAARARAIARSVRKLDFRLISGPISASPENGDLIASACRSVDMALLEALAFPEFISEGHITMVETILERIAELGTSIKSLGLPNAEAMQSNTTRTAVQAILPRLTKLAIDFESPTVGNGGDPLTMGSFNRLAVLDIAAWRGTYGHSTNHTAEWRYLIPQFVNLTSFSVIARDMSTSFGEHELSMLFDHAPGLKRLFLDTLDQRVVGVIAKKGANLESLYLCGASVGVFEVVGNLRNLSNFGYIYTAGNHMAVGDNEHFRKAFGQGKLLALELRPDSSRWQHHIKFVLTGNPSLKRLWIGSSLRRDIKVFSAAWEALREGSNPSLRCLRLPRLEMTREAFELELAGLCKVAGDLELVWVTLQDESPYTYERRDQGGVPVDGTSLRRLVGNRKLLWDSRDMLDPNHLPFVSDLFEEDE
ncbi:hypothetical protein M427DRAFT_62875 [Gonapodya prolifera JEL478]|uniref:F-box domain-containing protein n=1 Tax=Gonapodya prolifera (strain JEL478) TaxID=1344416 RepID=A0A139A033_GONPJ|nr:hypothetical protein M427DRAFT_62875 [Gonapodya prolifera JEL478]|eukprot:KXS10137.1 hypothetical protein M427DRAFT_62875 [Gonapodya prolifera JEL478]